MTPAIPESLNQPTIQAPVGHQLGPLSYHFREQRIGALLNVGHIVEVTNKLPTGGLRATSLPNSPQLLNTRTHELPAKVMHCSVGVSVIVTLSIRVPSTWTATIGQS